MANQGYRGNIKVGAASVMGADNIQFNTTRAKITTTAVNQTGGWESFITGLGGANFSFDANFEPTDSLGQITLINAVITPATATMTVMTDQSGANTTFGFTAIITDAKFKIGTKDRTVYSCAGTVTGAVTLT